MVIFFVVFFALYGSLNYYICLRGWQALSGLPALKPFYLIIFIISAISYVLAKVVSDYIPDFLYDVLLWIGSFWFAFMAYFFLSVIIIDILRLLNQWLNISPSFITTNYELTKQIALISVLVITTVLVVFGYINTRNVVTKSYEISLPRKNSELAELNIVFAADIHLSPLNDNKLLGKIADKINSLNPDIVVFAGDVVDDKASVLKSRGIGTAFAKIKSKYGIYACNGNHEFISGVKESVKYMEEHSIHVLRDSSKLIANSFYLVGRDDRSKRNFGGTDRKTLSQIMETTSMDYSSILIDHTPFNLEEAALNGIALQLSGHTHHGQIFPGNLITKMVYELSWGYLKKGNTQYYVTSGAGTWGPPVRIGSDTEIVRFKVRFK